MPRAYAPRKSSYYAYYTYYTYCINYTYYTNYTHYFQVRQDLGLADHVWQEKRTIIAQSVDNLGDQFRPAMRAGWLSYIRRAYPEDSAADAGPVVRAGIMDARQCGNGRPGFGLVAVSQKLRSYNYMGS